MDQQQTNATGSTPNIMLPAPDFYTQALSLDGNDWRIATDPQNQGLEQGWGKMICADTKTASVPGVMQTPFPGYHGVAWYWRAFDVPANPHENGRYLLRFNAVDYLAEVWINGENVGGHEGGETPFVLDITRAVKPGKANLLAVRVLNPDYNDIDGYTLKETPHGCKEYPIKPHAIDNSEGGVASMEPIGDGVRSHAQSRPPRPCPCGRGHETGDGTYCHRTPNNSGGIVDSVELLVAPAARIEDLHAVPDWQSGEILARINVRNAGEKTIDAILRVTVSPNISGVPCAASAKRLELPPGDTLVECLLKVPDHKLWSPEDPFLYRVDVSLQETGRDSADVRSTRCGFRDFRFENGWFRLNGKRFFPHGNFYYSRFPITDLWPSDPDMARRDVVNMKATGINLCRVVFGGSLARQLDIFDEVGVMVYMEHYGSWLLENSPKMAERYDRSLGEIVRRDRNHPSVVLWGALNETVKGPVFQHVYESALPLIRALDTTRMVMLNSGSFHEDHQAKDAGRKGPLAVMLDSGAIPEDHGTGSYSNPGSRQWQHGLLDTHDYLSVPHDASMLSNLRNWFSVHDPRLQTAGNKLFISEYGQCGAVHFPKYLRQFENRGYEQCDGAVYFRELLALFTADWQSFRLDNIWPRQDDYFEESQRNLATLRRIGANALRANPNLAAYCSSYAMTGGGVDSGIANHFRELKPGHADAVREETAPLRWCLFVDRVNIYRGDTIRLEAVLSNQDVLKPGDYPARIQVAGPAGTRILDKVIRITVPPAKDGVEPPFAWTVFNETLKIDGPQGRYRFLATLERGGAAVAGDIEFHLFDAAEMPAVSAEVTLWGEDKALADFLAKRSIRTRPFQNAAPARRELILACGTPPAPGGGAVFSELARRIARGAAVVFMDTNARMVPNTNIWAIPARCTTVFSKEGDAAGEHPTCYLLRHKKGSYENISSFCSYCRADHWAKTHPVFDGLPGGGIMDYHFYRDIIRNPNMAFTGINNPDEAIAGAVLVSGSIGGDDYKAGLTVFADRLGAGRFLVNDLKIRENLGTDPVAERLLRNMLNYMACGLDQPLALLPPDFNEQLTAIGHEKEAVTEET